MKKIYLFFGVILIGLLSLSFWMNVFMLSTHWYLNTQKVPSMLELINRARDVNHLSPLIENTLLDKSATAKACDMREKNYFEHISPSGKTPWDFIKEAGYKYKDAGENILKDDKGDIAIMIDFLASEEHRENILKPIYTEVGIGYCDNYVVQHFGNP